mmetsp:Transcript_8413/g.19711  ORF Transcript_8413/g.19711 Transcript_8413/m.19711 type:complete len:143 (+) Transcript_8413:43-471(+)
MRDRAQMVAESSFPKELQERVLASLQGLGAAKAGNKDIAAEEAIRAMAASHGVAFDGAVLKHVARALTELDEAMVCVRKRGLAADALVSGNMRDVNTRIKGYEARSRTYRQLLRELRQLPAPTNAALREVWRSDGAKQLLCL